MVLTLDLENHGSLSKNLVKDLQIAFFRRSFQADRDEDSVQCLAEFDGNFQKSAGGARLNTASSKDIPVNGGLEDPGVCTPANQVLEAVQLFGRVQGTVITYRIGEVEAESTANPAEVGGCVHVFHITVKIMLE